MLKSEAITLHTKHWEKFPVFVWDERGEFVTDVDGKVFRAKTPFGLDSKLDDAGIPKPRNLYFVDAPAYEHEAQRVANRAEPLLAKLRLSVGLESILIRRKDMQANHEEARQLAEMKQQKSNLSRAYLEHCGALEACDIMLEVRDKMIDARTELLRRALPMLSGAGAGVLANEICECIGLRSNN